MELASHKGVVEETFELTDASALTDPGWLAVRTTPASVASIANGRLAITGRVGLNDSHPQFVGRRQRHLTATTCTTVDGSAGVGGLAVRYDEDHWFSLEVRSAQVTARAHLAGLEQTWSTTVRPSDIELRAEMAPPAIGFTGETIGGDRIRLYAAHTLVAELDGRYWTAEICAFTGRVIGLYASEGTVRFANFRHRGTEG